MMRASTQEPVMSATLLRLPYAPRTRPSWARRTWQWLAQVKRVRDSRRDLAEMDPRMLADIGVSRATAQSEAARPAWDCSAAAF